MFDDRHASQSNLASYAQRLAVASTITLKSRLL